MSEIRRQRAWSKGPREKGKFWEAGKVKTKRAQGSKLKVDMTAKSTKTKISGLVISMCYNE
jgi:hypothetical protein